MKIEKFNARPPFDTTLVFVRFLHGLRRDMQIPRKAEQKSPNAACINGPWRPIEKASVRGGLTVPHRELLASIGLSCLTRPA